MIRNKITIPNSKRNEHLSETHQHLVKTICDQSHLCPLPTSVQPVYWQFDHALFLYPLPDVIILGDKVDQFESIYDGCHCMNPGSFFQQIILLLLTDQLKKKLIFLK